MVPADWIDLDLDLDLDPAFTYRGLRLEVAQADGQAKVVARRRRQEKNRFAVAIDHLSECVIEGNRPSSPGEEGLRDHELMEAIHEVARTGTVVTPPPVARPGAHRGSGPVEA